MDSMGNSLTLSSVPSLIIASEFEPAVQNGLPQCISDDGVVRIDGLYVAVHPVFTERFVADLQGSTSPFDGIDTMRVY